MHLPFSLKMKSTLKYFEEGKPPLQMQLYLSFIIFVSYVHICVFFSQYFIYLQIYRRIVIPAA